MKQNEKQVSISGIILIIFLLLNAVILKTAFTVNEKWYSMLLISVPLLLVSIKIHFTKKVAKALTNFKTK